MPTPEDEKPPDGVKKQMGKPMLQGGKLREEKSKGAGLLEPYLLEQIDHVIGGRTVCVKNKVRRRVMVPPGYIWTPRDYMHELVRDFIDMITSSEGKEIHGSRCRPILAKA